MRRGVEPIRVEDVKFPPRPKRGRKIEPIAVDDSQQPQRYVNSGVRCIFSVESECPCMARRRRPLDPERCRFTPRMFKKDTGPETSRVHSVNSVMTPFSDYSQLRTCRTGFPVSGVVTSRTGYTVEFTPSGSGYRNPTAHPYDTQAR